MRNMIRIIAIVLIPVLFSCASRVPARCRIIYTGDTDLLLSGPSEAYAADSVQVKVVQNEEVRTVVKLNGRLLQEKSDGTYVFIMPEGDAEIMLEKQEKTPVQEEERKLTMLVDCYTRTGMDEPYSETVLYRDQNGNLLVEEYENGGSDNEICRAYAASADAYEQAMKLIRKYGMAEWAEKGLAGPEGTLMVCRFADNGTYYRASSEEVPSGYDGYKEIEEVRKVLQDAADRSQLLYEKRH
ncbi:MAG: hypothetical protein IJ120_09810 [Solobacterium sp.]|nr:hypothetical protein [Solobacterium sp.]